MWVIHKLNDVKIIFTEVINLLNHYFGWHLHFQMICVCVGMGWFVDNNLGILCEMRTHPHLLHTSVMEDVTALSQFRGIWHPHRKNSKLTAGQTASVMIDSTSCMPVLWIIFEKSKVIHINKVFFFFATDHYSHTTLEKRKREYGTCLVTHSAEHNYPA